MREDGADRMDKRRIPPAPRMPQREIVGMLNATHEAQASANNLDAIVLAFDEATAPAVAEIAAWTLAASNPPPPQQR